MDKLLVRIFENPGGRDSHLASDLGDPYSVILHESANYLSVDDFANDVEIIFLVDPRRWSCNVPIMPS